MKSGLLSLSFFSYKEGTVLKDLVKKDERKSEAARRGQEENKGFYFFYLIMLSSRWPCVHGRHLILLV
jgi:hypothetical protein